jgi:hypothetical protein
MTTTITDAADLVGRLDRAWRSDLEAHRTTRTPHDAVYASAFRVCERRMVYELTVPDQQPAFDADVIARIGRGIDRERDILADLVKVGRNAEPPFVITNQQQRFVLRDRKSRSAITGKVDAFLELGTVRAPIEVKAWSPYVVDRIERFADVLESPWTATAAYQLLAYMFGAAVPFGLFVLDRSGVPKLIPVELDPHLELVETFLTRAEAVLDHVAAGTLPDYLDGDPDECMHRCPFFGGTCDPPLSATDTLAVLNDPELEAALERREELRTPGKAFNELDSELKHRLRGITRGVVGKFEIRGAWGKQSRLELPPAVKTQYTRVDPHGRFTLQIIKHG